MGAVDRRAYLISDRRLNRRLNFRRNQMQKIDTLTHAAKVVALCLPPLVMSLIGLAGLSRKKGGVAVVAGKKPAPKLSALRRSGTG
jgi:hypothetical protein